MISHYSQLELVGYLIPFTVLAFVNRISTFNCCHYQTDFIPIMDTFHYYNLHFYTTSKIEFLCMLDLYSTAHPIRICVRVCACMRACIHYASEYAHEYMYEYILCVYRQLLLDKEYRYLQPNNLTN